MKDRSLPNLALPLLLLGCLCIAAAAHAGPVVYLDAVGKVVAVDNPAAADAVSALNALAGGPPGSLAAMGVSSAIPRGTRVLDLNIDGNTAEVNFSRRLIAGGVDDARIEAIFQQVKWTLWNYGIDLDIAILVNGIPLADFAPAAPVVRGPGIGPPDLSAMGALSGQSITLSPGHGVFWNGSGWYTQRPVYCAPLNEEDFHNLENSQYLETYLAQDGMTVKMVRCTDKDYGNHYTGNAWWKMAAYLWLEHIGYPCTVYASYTDDCTTGTNDNEVNDDIRARPLASDYDGTDIYISLHTNGYGGDCYGSCPTGSDIYYDCSGQHRRWCDVSLDLATVVNNAMIDAIQSKMPDTDWVNRGIHDSNGAYGEIRIPDRAAILIELGFHDTCDHDAVHLRDNFFRSTAMWGIYKGVCDYFSVTPTWDYYSDEYISDDIPTLMATGQQSTVHVTFRNRGVLWTEAYQIRLGAVGDSDPFTNETRHNIDGEVDPSGDYTFTFTVTAPSTEGTYVSDWQMVRENVTWFGDILSKTIEVTTEGDVDPPTVPTNVVATPAGPYQVDLTWDASTDNVGVTGYNIYRDSVLIDSSTTTSYSDTTVQHSTTYTYEVTAYDAAENESAKSSPAIVTTPEADLTPPTVPTNLVAIAINGTQVDLTWDPSTDNVGVTGYNIYRDSALIDSSPTPGYSDTTCEPDTTYTYEVTAYDAAENESAKSDPAIVTTPNDIIIIDNPACELYGSWSTGVTSQDKYGDNYYFAATAKSETAWARWRPDITIVGNYDVYVWYPQGSNRSVKAPYTVYYDGGSTTVKVNQTGNGGKWNLIVSAVPFAQGTAGYVHLSNNTKENNKVVMADAVKFQYVGS